MRAFLGGLVLAVGLCVGLVSAQASENRILNSVSGADLVSILQKQGFDARATLDQFGDPLIIAKAGEITFTIWTYGCEPASGTEKRCNQLQFLAEFALSGNPSVETLAAINEYNRRKRFGRAVLQHTGTATVDMTVNLRQGVTQDNLIDNLVVWVVVLADFVDTLGWNSVSA
jgi:hypothetical protein